MRLIDFIIFNNFPTNTKKSFSNAMQHFLRSHFVCAYVEAIKRKTNSKEILKKIEQLLNQYWQEINQDPIIIAANTILNGKSTAALEEIFRVAAHNPVLIKKEEEIITLIVNEGRPQLIEEHNRTLAEAIGILHQEKRLLDFNEYLTLYFPSNETTSRTVTLQQFISYVCFVKSVIQPFSEFSLDSESKKQAIAFCECCTILEKRIEKFHHTLITLTSQLEDLEYPINTLQHFYYSGNAQEPTSAGHDLSCPATVSYRGIISLWKWLQKISYLEQFYAKKEKQYYTELLFMSVDDAAINLESEYISLFLERVKGWQEEIAAILKRASTSQKIRDFERTSTKDHDTLFRYIQEEEFESLSTLKCFAQRKSSINDNKAFSFERAKWFFATGGDPGHSARYKYRCVIHLYKDALVLLEGLAEKDNPCAAVMKKENENNCLGIHEDILPLFNGLVQQVKVYSNQNANKPLQIIDFDKPLENSPHQVLLDSRVIPLFFLQPYQPYSVPHSSNSTNKEVICEEDEIAFEEWYERGTTVDLLTGAAAPSAFLAYTFGLQMSVYGNVFARKYLINPPNKIVIRTGDKTYILTKSATLSDAASQIKVICNTTWAEFLATLRDKFADHLISLEAVFTSMQNMAKSGSDYKLVSKHSDSIKAWLKKCAEIEKEAFLISKGGKPTRSSIQKLETHKRAFRNRVHQIFTLYFDFITRKSIVDAYLIRAFLFLSCKNVTIILEQSNAPFVIDTLEMDDWERIFIFSHAADSTLCLLQLESIDNKPVQIISPKSPKIEIISGVKGASVFKHNPETAFSLSSNSIDAALASSQLSRRVSTMSGNNCLLDSYYQLITSFLKKLNLEFELGNLEIFIEYVRKQISKTNNEMLQINEDFEGVQILSAIKQYIYEKTGLKVGFDLDFMVVMGEEIVSVDNIIGFQLLFRDSNLRIPIKIIQTNDNHYEPVFSLLEELSPANNMQNFWKKANLTARRTSSESDCRESLFFISHNRSKSV